MTRRVIECAVGCCLVLLLFTSNVFADGIPPVQMQVRELASGAFDVEWSIPKSVPPQFKPAPWLPEQCQPEGDRTAIDKPSSWFSQQVYNCPGGLAGEWLGVRYATYNIGISTLLRVELLSGDHYAHLLSAGAERWQVPTASAGGLAEFYLKAQETARAGIQHFFDGWVHLAFMAILCLLGGLRAGVRLATAFFLAQAGAAIFSSLSAISLSTPVAEVGIALATVLLARQARLPAGDRQQLTLLAICAGVVHGLAVQNLIAPTDQTAVPGMATLLLFVFGMDTALLVAVALISGIGRLLPGRLVRAPLPAFATTGVAGISVALAIGLLINGPVAQAGDDQKRLELPSFFSPSGAALPGSRRLASNKPDAAFQSFVSIEAFEVRHEVLVRLRDVAARVGGGAGPELAIGQQDEVKQRIRDLVFAHSWLEIDGKRVEPASERVDFLTVDNTGVLPRPVPVPETVETAWVGVTTVFLTPTTSQSLEVGWDFIEGAAEIPATATDPETTRSVLLHPGEPVLRWDNELTEDPVPRISATEVEPAELVIPAWSVLPLLLALLLLATAIRGRKPVTSFAAARVMLVIAILLGPLGNVAIALPASVGTVPGTGQAKRILARVLPNIYRSFEFREESAVFDRLAMAVTGDTLTEVYLGQRKVLELEDRGGAKARVEAVEVIDVDSVEAGDPAGFSAHVEWTVGGTVTHFGHRHFRQNHYEAIVTLVPDADVWKIRHIEVLDEKRIR